VDRYFIASGFIEGVAGAVGRSKVDEIVHVHILEDAKEVVALAAEMIEQYCRDTMEGS
jgi:hypothetical protein